MEAALYGENGYYASGRARPGRGGDFYTSVSAGRCFGLILARRIAKKWMAWGKPEPFFLVEAGAHDGQLLADIGLVLMEVEPDLARAVHFVTIEPLPLLARWQEEKISAAAGKEGRFSTFPSLVEWAKTLPQTSGFPSPQPSVFFIANELLDAFPVHRLRKSTDGWEEAWVASQAAPTLEYGEVSDPALAAEMAALEARLPFPLPTGYKTELCPAAHAWMREFSALPWRGEALFFDYGWEEEADYYAPHRHTGTLRRYFQHRCDENFLENPGKADLTADVNFAAVVRAAEAGGITSHSLADQGRWLTETAREWLLSLEGKSDSGTAALMRQFRTLTHPGLMGRRFKVLSLEK